MIIESDLLNFRKEIQLKDGTACLLRPLKREDEQNFHAFYLEVPEQERMFIKYRVTDRAVIHEWCRNIDLGRKLPLLAMINGNIAGVTNLHQQLGGWKRHIGRVSVLVLPQYRNKGLARSLIQEILLIARSLGLEKLEAEFIGEQEAAIKMFALLGFSNLLRLNNYVKDMQAVKHDYVLMGLDLVTDEEYAGMG